MKKRSLTFIHEAFEEIICKAKHLFENVKYIEEFNTKAFI